MPSSWVAIIVAVITVSPQFLKIYLSHSSKKNSLGTEGQDSPATLRLYRFWLPIALPVLLWGGYVFYDRVYPVTIATSTVAPPPITQPFKIDKWGTFANHSNPTFTAEFDSGPILAFAKRSKLYLAVTVNRPEVDMWTDPDIELSTPYTVVGNYMSIAVVTTGKLKIAPPPNATSFNEFLLFLPDNIDPRSVTSLASVLQLGGSVFARGGISVMPQPQAPTSGSDATGPKRRRPEKSPATNNGNVSSTNQNGGVTAGTIDTVTQ